MPESSCLIADREAERSSMRTTSVQRTTGALLAVLVALGPAHSAAESVTMVSYGGSYADACEEAYLKPFTARTGIEVTLDDYNGGLSQVPVRIPWGAFRR